MDETALWRSRLRLNVLTRCTPSVQASAHVRQEPMMAETIAFVLRNLPVFLFVAALVLAGLSRSGAAHRRSFARVDPAPAHWRDGPLGGDLSSLLP